MFFESSNMDVATTQPAHGCAFWVATEKYTGSLLSLFQLKKSGADYFSAAAPKGHPWPYRATATSCCCFEK